MNCPKGLVSDNGAQEGSLYPNKGNPYTNRYRQLYKDKRMQVGVDQAGD